MKRISPRSLSAPLRTFVVLIVLVGGDDGWIRLSLASTDEVPSGTRKELLHPKYKLPSRCFAYVGNPADRKTWKLPYLLPDGRPDLKRLPKAIQAVIGNYRGARVSGIPEREIPDVLTRLGRAAVQAGKMPFQLKNTAPIYRQLQATLEKLGRLEEIKADAFSAPSRP